MIVDSQALLPALTTFETTQYLAAGCAPDQICRLEYPLLPGGTPTYLYSVFVVVLVVFFYGVYRKFSIYGIGWAQVRENAPGLIKRAGIIAKDGFAQRKILQRRFGGLMHSWMFYGITALTIGTILVGMDYDILRPAGIVLLQGDFYLGFKTVLDIMGTAFVIAVALALARRLSFKPFFLVENRADRWILAGMLYMGISGFVQEGLRLALIPVPWAYFSPVGSIAAGFFTSLGAGPDSVSVLNWVNLYRTLWWIHAMVAFALIASIPYTKFFHVPNALINMIRLDAQRPIGRMTTPFSLAEIMKQTETNPDYSPDLSIGIKTSTDLNWSQRAMLDACTNCGRCEAACPANAAGRDLSPREVVQDLKSQFYRDYKVKKTSKEEHAPDLFAAGAIRDVEMFSCVMCAACVYECPVDINQLDFISDLRRTIVSANRLDSKQTAMLSNLAAHQNPYGFSNSSRSDWAKTVDGPSGVKTINENPQAEYLYWVGCVCSFDQRAQNIAKSLAKIITAAGISFAILGSEELCNGDPARRLGEEGRYQELAIQNIEKMNSFGVRKIITSCPHCFNTLKNEYPTFGGNYSVIHHSQLISELIKEGRIKIPPEKVKEISITLHDACYAVRMNNIFDEPRKVLNATGAELKEMYRCKEKTFCCGAGGSNYWYKVPQQKSITGIRLDEAVKTGAGTLATECPFCLTMFEDANRVGDSKLQVKDISEMVAEVL
ncbi:MAG TPA: heterodisulfide reductase-related iron-sulfur binding cluster [Nitrososphaerales archaeon]|nr:heterodisulfide reductase-related iron-sulfur binding cluster [Nitrososphaerales archaeon]